MQWQGPWSVFGFKLCKLDLNVATYCWQVYTAEQIVEKGRVFHTGCFTCKKCKKPLKDKVYHHHHISCADIDYCLTAAPSPRAPRGGVLPVLLPPGQQAPGPGRHQHRRHQGGDRAGGVSAVRGQGGASTSCLMVASPSVCRCSRRRGCGPEAACSTSSASAAAGAGTGSPCRPSTATRSPPAYTRVARW